MRIRIRTMVAIATLALVLSSVALAEPHRLFQTLLNPATQGGVGTTTTSGIFCKDARHVWFIIAARNMNAGGAAPTITLEGAQIDSAANYSGIANFGQITQSPSSLTKAVLSLGGEKVVVYHGDASALTGAVWGLPVNFLRAKITTGAADSIYHLSVRAIAQWGDPASDGFTGAPLNVMSVPGCSIDASGNLTVSTTDGASLANIPIGAGVFYSTKLNGGFAGMTSAATLITSKTDNNTATVSPNPSSAISNVTLKFLIW